MYKVDVMLWQNIRGTRKVMLKILCGRHHKANDVRNISEAVDNVVA